jgi:hypothetical protein
MDIHIYEIQIYLLSESKFVFGNVPFVFIVNN